MTIAELLMFNRSLTEIDEVIEQNRRDDFCPVIDKCLQVNRSEVVEHLNAWWHQMLYSRDQTI